MAARIESKRASKARKIMNELYAKFEYGGVIHTYELWRMSGSGMSARIAELRTDLKRFGWDIRCETHEDGAVYELTQVS